MLTDPLDRLHDRKIREITLEQDPLEAEGARGAAGTDHAEWFLMGLIIFGLVAEVAIVVTSISATT